MIIKVCGMRDPENIKDIEIITEIDMMGFIFARKSPRFVGDDNPAYLPEKCRRVGVFVNQTADEINRRCKQYKLNAIQLHGTETPDFCTQIKEICDSGISVIKAISVSKKEDINLAKRYTGYSDLLLFDTASTTGGGSGRCFDWSLLDAYDGEIPFLLSGGINQDSADDLNMLKHPKWAGIDLNSRFEISPAIKNAEMLRTFIQKLKKQ